MSLNERLISVGAAACTTDSVNPFGPNDAFSSNIALYQFDGNANDTTTNYNGAPTDITYGTGYIDQAAVFNGSSSYIDLGTSLLGSRSAFSVSTWVNFDNLNTQNFIFFTSESGTGGNVGFYDFGNGSIYFQPDASTSTNRGYISNSGIYTTDEWVHIVMVFDGSATGNSNRLKVYIQGAERTLTYDGTIPSSTGTSTANSWIGGRASTKFSGDIDQVRIFDSAITAENVATLYAETAATASNTNPLGQGSGVALYTLDYDASDAGGLYDGVPTNVDFGVEGHINYGAGFNGSTSFIDTNNVFSNNVSKITYSAWAYFDNLNTQNFIMFPDSGNTGAGFGFFDYGNGNLYVQSDNTTNSNRGLVSNSGLYNTNEWVHFAIVFDGTATGNSDRLKAYVNSNLVTLTFEGTIPTTTKSSSYNLLIGSRGGGISFSGSIDQVRIFQSALDSTQVTQLYDETACVYTCTTDTVDYPTTNVAYYKLDNTAEDETGTYDGTATNVNYTFGRFGQAAVFNGSSSKIDTSLSLDTNNVGGGSISLWFNTSQTTPTQILIGSQTAQNSGSYGTSILLGPSTGASASESISVWDYNGGTTSAFYTEGGSDFYQDGNWHHLVITSTSSTKNIYIDGVSQTISYTGSGSASANLKFTDIQIGATLGYTGTNYFDGKLDQVRIFSSVLTSTQVESLYNEKPCEDTSNFKTVLYTGNGGTQYISNVGFEPDLVWIKDRFAAAGHWVNDSVRGAGKGIMTQSTSAEITSLPELMSSFGSNGFTVGYISNNTTNFINNSYVAWCWKAGGDAVSNTDGSITSQVSANTDAGFSIVKYTGNATAGATIGHGLSSAPELIIGKRLVNAGGNWTVYAEPVGATAALQLNTSIGAATATAYFNDTAPTNSVFTLGSNGNLNNTEETIAYCWHSVAGYSKIGSYTGATGGVTENIGFQPRWIMIKDTTDGVNNWVINDAIRDTSNPRTAVLFPNISNAEGDNIVFGVNFTSNGFEIPSTTTSTAYNKNGNTYIYLAIA